MYCMSLPRPYYICYPNHIRRMIRFPPVRPSLPRMPTRRLRRMWNPPGIFCRPVASPLCTNIQIDSRCSSPRRTRCNLRPRQRCTNSATRMRCMFHPSRHCCTFQPRMCSYCWCHRKVAPRDTDHNFPASSGRPLPACICRPRTQRKRSRRAAPTCCPGRKVWTSHRQRRNDQLHTRRTPCCRYCRRGCNFPWHRLCTRCAPHLNIDARRTWRTPLIPGRRVCPPHIAAPILIHRTRTRPGRFYTWCASCPHHRPCNFPGGNLCTRTPRLHCISCHYRKVHTMQMYPTSTCLRCRSFSFGYHYRCYPQGRFYTPCLRSSRRPCSSRSRMLRTRCFPRRSNRSHQRWRIVYTTMHRDRRSISQGRN